MKLRQQLVSMHGGARWPSELEHWTGDRVVLGLNPAETFSLRNFGKSVYPRFASVFRMRLSGVYARGSKIAYRSAPEMCNLS